MAIKIKTDKKKTKNMKILKKRTKKCGKTETSFPYTEIFIKRLSIGPTATAAAEPAPVAYGWFENKGKKNS